ncbi:hypothetical protein EVG20_g644 [Dentipellis fragilis]|uniref:Vesicle transport v-SNARE N-terminal domain-containing protein n=1 Tax=Dentipellis fragilis TaxID=205917 RepID=A0A4Y9ZEP2_9AGAM|nr:hypothetical protein EVG20_g644 [Dentipellis fragilis]
MDNSPTALFDSYEQDFQQIVQSIREKLEGEAKDGQGGEFRFGSTLYGPWGTQTRELVVSEKKKAALRRVEMELDEADEMVSQMEIEIQGIPQSLKGQFQARIKSAKADLTRYKKLSKDMHAQLTRADLLASTRGGAGTPTSDEPYGTSDRSRLLAGTNILEDGTRRLQETHRVALETEEQGADILRSLRGQREQIENARDTVSFLSLVIQVFYAEHNAGTQLRTADTSIGRAAGTLKKMIRRMYQQRFVTAGIIIVLVLLIAIILWEKLH